MSTRANTTTRTLGVLLVAGTISLLLPEHESMPGAYAQVAPDTIRLPGMVRDFQASHADFDVLPSAGYGHYAGNVNVWLNSSKQPALSGWGFKVNAQWLNSGVDPIPPHLALSYSASMEVPVVNGPTLHDDPIVDTFDSSAGAYGGENVGPAPTFVTGSSMPTIPEPTGLGPLIEEVLYEQLLAHGHAYRVGHIHGSANQDA